MRIAIAFGTLAMIASAAQAGDPVKRVTSDAPIAAAVIVPGDARIVYVSGQVPNIADPAADPMTPAAYGDTTTQTVSVIGKIDAILKAQGMTLGDVVMMRVFLVGDPAKGGKMDFAGMMAGYKQFFGTAEQPNKPARSTVQVAGLAAPGFLVEIEVTAAKAR